MPVPAPLSSFEHVPETKVDLPWADLPTIDLSRFHSHKAALAEQLISAVRTKGFFYVKVRPSFDLKSLSEAPADRGSGEGMGGHQPGAGQPAVCDWAGSLRTST